MGRALTVLSAPKPLVVPPVWVLNFAALDQEYRDSECGGCSSGCIGSGCGCLLNSGGRGIGAVMMCGYWLLSLELWTDEVWSIQVRIHLTSE